MNIGRWLGHATWQPAWRKHRWRTQCRSCHVELTASSRDRKLFFLLPLAFFSIALGFASRLRPEHRPYPIVTAIVVLVIALVVHYWIASYELVDVNIDSETLPEARAKARTK